MLERSRTYLLRIAPWLAALCVSGCGSSSVAATLPDPAVDAAKTADKRPATAVFAGGCFWGVEAVFKHVKGVTSAVSGYAGGSAKTAHYEIIGMGLTGHAESVQVTYDPSQISYGQLLRVFFSVAHDPTEVNRQGPDSGTQYRSAIFYTSEQQRKTAEEVKARVARSGKWKHPVVTQIVAAGEFTRAEEHHQKYLEKNPGGYMCHYLRD